MTDANRDQLYSFFYRVIILDGCVKYNYYSFWRSQWSIDKIELTMCHNEKPEDDIVILKDCSSKLGLAFVLTKEEIYDIINGCMPGECKIDKGDFKIHCVARMALVNYATNFFIENYGEKFSKIT
jgi:hypothetical protein